MVYIVYISSIYRYIRYSLYNYASPEPNTLAHLHFSTPLLEVLAEANPNKTQKQILQAFMSFLNETTSRPIGSEGVTTSTHPVRPQQC